LNPFEGGNDFYFSIYVTENEYNEYINNLNSTYAYGDITYERYGFFNKRFILFGIPLRRCTSFAYRDLLSNFGITLGMTTEKEIRKNTYNPHTLFIFMLNNGYKAKTARPEDDSEEHLTPKQFGE
jgi:hypothetical protein